MAGVAERVFALIRETVEQQGVSLWDVCFVKEGAAQYLRVFIDKPEGIGIDDCTAVSHAIDPLLDEYDPIDTAYYLEVCSSGSERELNRSEHFTQMLGRPIRVRLFRARDGKKEFIGILRSYDGGITLETETGEIHFNRGEFSKVNLNEE